VPESSPHAAPTPLPLPSTPPASATDRDACAVCHSPLSPEARYCLQCGARRAGARLEFLDVLDERSGPAADGARRPIPAAALPASPARLDALRSWPFGLTAVVLLALLIGLLAGHWINDRTDDAAGTQVIRVEGAAGGGAAAPAASSAAPATAAPSSAAPAATATAKPKATAPKKITRDSEKQALDDTSGNENLAPEDPDPNGANFDEIK
jgi:hypothetical protein